MIRAWHCLLAAFLSISLAAVAGERIPHALGCRPELLSAAAPKGSATNTSSTSQATPPATVDLSANCPPVFNQGSIGSCASCATGYCIKGYLEKVEHGWDATLSSHQYCPNYLYNQINGGKDTGSYFTDNAGVMVWRGITTLADQPYSGTNYTAWPTQTQCLAAQKWRDGLVSGSTFGAVANSDLTTIKNKLASGTPLLIGIEVDSAWDNLSGASNYVWYPNGLNMRGGHAIAVIGYDDNITDNNGHVGALKIQNSWGTGWGQSGRAWIAYAALTNVGVQQGGLGYCVDGTAETSTIQAQIQVNHSKRGTIRIDLGVGSTSTPVWSYSYYPKTNMGEDTTHANVYTTLDLSSAAAYWPPSNTQKWWVRVTDDLSDSTTGTVVQFDLVNGTKTLSTTTALPLAIPDSGSVYAYIDGNAPILTSVAVSPSSASVLAGATQQFTAIALDQNSNPMTPQPAFTWAVSGGGTISSSGLFTAGPTAGGPYTVSATANGMTGTASVVVTVNTAPPVITSALTAGGTAGFPFSYTITATNSPTSFNATGLPAGLNPNTSTGLISGTPVAAGTYNIALTASNGSGTSAPATLTLTLIAAGAGALEAWGYNNHGQLGDGTITERNAPISVPGLSGVTAVACGAYHTIALMSDGTVKTWGFNAYGQLGIGTTTDQLSPVTVPGLSGVKAIAAGWYHSLAVMNDGTVRAWGYNGKGELGDGTTTGRLSPVAVTGLTNVKSLAAGWYHSVAVLNDGTVRAWGSNSNGQLGDGTTTQRNAPVTVPGVTGATVVAAGINHTAVVLSNGSMQTWGANAYGQLGDGATADRWSPVSVSGMSGAKNVACGEYHTVVLMNDGTVQGFGYNSYGNLGDGTQIQRTTPVAAIGVSGVVSLAAAYQSTVAVLSDGTVKTWGSNSYGELGDGKTESLRSTAVTIFGLTGVSAASAGTGQVMVVK